MDDKTRKLNGLVICLVITVVAAVTSWTVGVSTPENPSIKGE